MLNHPTRKANPLRASRKPLPALAQPAPILPKPFPTSHYDGYLKQIAPLYETFVQSQAAAAASSSTPVSELDLQASKAADLPSLNSIPSMFFDSNFDIANPNNWTQVMDMAESSSKPGDAAIQDSLSTCLDNLERHLVHEITLRSSSFFSALANLQDLNSESSSCLTRIADLKGSLADVGGKQARKGLEIIDAQSRLRSLRVTEGGIKRVAELHDCLRIAKGMADGGDWAGALSCVEDVVKWWERNGDDESLPLTTLPAFANLPTSIAALTSNVASQVETSLSAALLSLLSTTSDFDKDTFRNAVGPMLIGLVRCGCVDALAGVWRNEVTNAIRQGLRQHLPIVDEDDIETRQTGGLQQSGQSLAQSLQTMDHHAFLTLSEVMYASMLARLHLVQQMGEEMATMLSEHSDIPTLSITARGATTPPTTSKAQFEPSEVLTSACELANTRASKIISVRSEQHAELPLDQFVAIFNESWSFVVATESLARRMIVSLRGVLSSQAKSFLVQYHAERLTKSAKFVEEETWVQIDVSPRTQHMVDLLVAAAVQDPDECFIPPRPNGTTNGEAPRSVQKFISVEDKTFFVVKATAESLTLLGDYLWIVVNLELVVTDVMSRIVEFLKSFNSRTCQVVLGAGAMRSAGLKNITAKHLALASQSLSVVVALIPYIREFIRRHLNPRQAVMLVEFDRIKRDYQEHQNEIHAKLVAIMADRLAVHCGELREIDWEATPDKEGPRGYALMLVKETATLHKVLSKYLAPQTVEVVMSQVLAASVHRLGEEYTKVEFKSDEAKQRMLQDVALIATRLTPLSETSTSISGLEKLVRDKPTPRKAVAAAMRGLLRRNGTADKDTPLAPGDVPEEEEIDEEGGGLVTEDAPPASPLPQDGNPMSPGPSTPRLGGPSSPTKLSSPVKVASPSRPAALALGSPTKPASPSASRPTTPGPAPAPVPVPAPIVMPTTPVLGSSLSNPPSPFRSPAKSPVVRPFPTKKASWGYEVRGEEPEKDVEPAPVEPVKEVEEAEEVKPTEPTPETPAQEDVAPATPAKEAVALEPEEPNAAAETETVTETKPEPEAAVEAPPAIEETTETTDKETPATPELEPEANAPPSSSPSPGPPPPPKDDTTPTSSASAAIPEPSDTPE